MLRILTALVLTVSLAAAAGAGDCRSDAVELRGDWGQLRFTVEIADTPESRSRGLMFREQMPRMAGMLFVYEKPGRASFWMKNTLIPLDIIFADRTGLVTRVHSGAIPGDLTPIDGGRQVFAVLEINAGLAKRFGISPGTHMRHQVFDDGPAIWPC